MVNPAEVDRFGTVGYRVVACETTESVQMPVAMVFREIDNGS